MSKLIVTGGSGFVGTNLVEYFLGLGWDVLNIDIVAPRNSDHARLWTKIDVRDSAGLLKKFNDFSPTHIFHMGARTDLEGGSLESYSANTEGVLSLINATSHLPALERILFASSMLVCPLGYIPKHELDFQPINLYGKSKVIGEQYVRKFASGRFPWTIVRPTSLWGPWFDLPYLDFFSAVSRRMYVHPAGHRIHRSYGFVLNAVHQIEKMMTCSDKSLIDGRVFYLADYEPIELLAWSKLISQEFDVAPPMEVPLSLLQLAALGGDIAKKLGIKRIPLSTPRLDNLLTEAIYDLQPLMKVSGVTPYSVEEAVHMTANWMKKKHLEKSCQ